MTYGIVILHYRSLSDTRICVRSVLRLTGSKHIVVVDNGSKDGSGQILEREYQKHTEITVLQNSRNLGFAQGNNVGIGYLRDHFHCSFVIVLNSDTETKQTDFLERISQEYDYSHFAVLGPRVITPDGGDHTNPVGSRLYTQSEIGRLIFKRKIKYLLCKCCLHWLIHPAGFGKKSRESFDSQKRYEGVILHGCCLIFSEDYFRKFDGFDERTFLYFEEDVLFANLQRAGLKSVYSPKLILYHKEDGSTGTIVSQRKRSMFVFENEIRSLKVLRSVLENENKDCHVFIIGSKGIPASYGGFETFVDRLTYYTSEKERVQYHVACISSQNTEEFYYHGARCFSIKVPQIGAAKAVIYDLFALRECICYIRSHHLKNVCIYVLASRIGPFIGYYKKVLVSLGCCLYLNPDGHEWKRSKWNTVIRFYWKFSESLMVRHADLVVCDSKNMQSYIRKKYQNVKKTCFIPYGAEAVCTDAGEQKTREWMKSFGVESGGYYLVVGRLVPENNYLTIIREFMKTATKKCLILITTKEEIYYQRLKREVDFDSDSRICFCPSIYDNELLCGIRRHAFAYIHGHEVGGTNPSLLEAMANTRVNLLLRVCFNEEVGENAVKYWTKEPGSLSHLISDIDHMSDEDANLLGEAAKKIIRNRYDWNHIADSYIRIFKEAVQNVR